MAIYNRMVQKNCPFLKMHAPRAARQLNLPMHSQSAIHESICAKFTELSAISFPQPCTLYNIY